MTENAIAPKRGNAPWVKGQSGNPAGRPKGSKNAITLLRIMVEGELRAQMRGQMQRVLEKIINQALDGNEASQKLLYESWVSKSRAGSDDDAPKEKVQIVIGRLDQNPPPINGRVMESEHTNEES